jgi:hypothetical protein
MKKQQQTHTPEPWRAKHDYEHRFSIETADGIDMPATAYREANAQRIVACVNSLAGIPDPAAALTQAREALEMFLRNYAADCDPDGEELDQARAALAALEGRAQP